MILKSISLLVLVLSLSLVAHLTRAQRYEAFSQSDEEGYLESFDTLIKDSYSAPLPQDLISRCKNKYKPDPNLPTRTIQTSMSASEVQSFCGFDSTCTISAGVEIRMNTNLDVAALVLSGKLTWTDSTQLHSDQWLCAGYIAVKYINTQYMNIY